MPSPYTRDLFAAMASDGRLDIKVFYMELSAPDTHWQDEELPPFARVMPGQWRNVLGGRVHTNPGALEGVLDCKPEVVVVAGYSSITSQRLMRGLTKAGVPWVFWGESPGMRPRGVVRPLLRYMAMRPVIRRAHGVAAIGSRAQRTYRQLCGDGRPVDNIPYCCDMSPFAKASAGRIPGSRAGVRFLYCGQLIDRKGVDLLLAGFIALAEERPEVELDLVGTGPMEQELKRRAAALEKRVRFHGFQPVELLPTYFADADIFVLPSRHDGWGVVVNQAIAAGLPVICSDAVGAADDLVEVDGNGLIVPAGDAASLAKAMARLADDPGMMARFGARSREIAQKWEPARVVDRWWDLLAKVVRPRVSTVATAT